MKLLPGLKGSERQAALEHNAQNDGAAGAGTDAGRPGHRPAENPMTRILDGMQELRDGMGGLKAALTVMAPTMTTKDDMAALKTAMETGLDAMSKRLDAMEERMSKRLDAMEERVQSLQDGWKVVPDEDDASGTGGGTNELDVNWSWNPRWGWQGCRRRRTLEDGARGSR